MEMTPPDAPTFWVQFWPNLIATLFGAFFGVVLALWFNRRGERAAHKSEEATLLRALRGNALTNLAIIANLKPLLATRGDKIPSAQVDVGLVDAIIPRLVQVSADVELNTYAVAYEWGLHSIERTLDNLVTASFHTIGDPRDALAKAAFLQRLAKMASLAENAVNRVERMVTETLLPHINARIGPPQA